MKVRANDDCPCGSGRKYKKCHGSPGGVALAFPEADVSSLIEKGRRLIASGQLPEAEQCLQRALELEPAAVEAWRALGDLADKAGDSASAQACYGRVIDLRPGDAVAHFALGNALVRSFAFEQASDAYLRAVALAPTLGGAWGNLGNVQKYLGQFARATESYARQVECEPDPVRRARCHSNLLFSLHYNDELSHQALFDAHCAWADLYARAHYPRESPQPTARDSAKALKVGYLSGSMNAGILRHFFLDVLAHHDRTQVEVHIYSSTQREDATTARYREHCHAWVDIAQWDDAGAAQRIRDDAIDILVDLHGHAPTGRPLVVARKPAPIVVEWLDWFDTTGMPVVDYILTDPYTTPPNSPQRFVETPVRLPHSRFCYAPPDYAPSVAPAPCIARGHVTFGAFNRQDKVSPELLRIWSRILQAVPSARLLLKNRALEAPGVQARVHDAFARCGVDPARVELRGPSTHPSMLAEYSEVDIALDTFPYNGGLTTCECLWMGVPIVALESERMIGRQTAAMLRLLGLDDWIAASSFDYVDLAVKRVGDPEALAALRQDIRRRMASSPLCDAARFAGDLERIYRDFVTAPRPAHATPDARG